MVKYSEEDKIRVISLYCEGNSYQEIADETEIPFSTISKWIMEYNRKKNTVQKEVLSLTADNVNSNESFRENFVEVREKPIVGIRVKLPILVDEVVKLCPNCKGKPTVVHQFKTPTGTLVASSDFVTTTVICSKCGLTAEFSVWQKLEIRNEGERQ